MSDPTSRSTRQNEEPTSHTGEARHRTHLCQFCYELADEMAVHNQSDVMTEYAEIHHHAHEPLRIRKGGDMNQLVPIADAQSALGGISRTTIYRLVEEGRLQRVNIGRRSFITGDSINQYINILTEVSR